MIVPDFEETVAALSLEECRSLLCDLLSAIYEADWETCVMLVKANCDPDE